MPNPQKIAIIILAAGDSSRMGTPKQLLKWGDSTLLGHSIDQAIKSEAHEVFVVLGAHHSAINKAINLSAVTVLKNDDWELGMGNSISYGVRQIQNKGFDGILLMLADQPEVDTNLLNRLITDFNNGQHPIIASMYGNQAGVPAIFDNSYSKQLALLHGHKGAQHLLQENQANVAILKTETPITDIDTKEDYENLYRHYFGT